MLSQTDAINRTSTVDVREDGDGAAGVTRRENDQLEVVLLSPCPQTPQLRACHSHTHTHTMTL